MNRKEWREVGLQSLYFVLAAAGMVLLAFAGDLLGDRPLGGEKIAIILGLLLLMFSMFLGLSPFAMDATQKGMEYLLTLPLARRRLLLIKFLPRLTAVTFFYLAFAVVYRLAGDQAFGGGFTLFSLIYGGLFLISFSLSVVHENFIVQSLWAGVALSGYAFLCLFVVAKGFSWKFAMPARAFGTRAWQSLSYDAPTLLSAAAVFLLLALPFLLSLFLAFKKFDLKPARAFNRRQWLIFVPLLLLACGLSLGITWLVQRSAPAWEPNYFILGQQRLLKADSPGRLTLFTPAGRRPIAPGRPIYWGRPLLERGELLYLSGIDFKDGARIIGCLNLADLSWKTVHRIQGPARIANDLPGIRFDGERFVFLLIRDDPDASPGKEEKPAAKPKAMQLVQVDPAAGRSKALEFQAPAGRYNEPWLVGSDERDGRRFWLAASRGHAVLRLWADGRSEELGPSEGIPVYAGGLLFSRRGGSLAVTRLLESGSEIVGEIPGDFTMGNPYFFSLEDSQGSEVYAEREGRIVRIDLASLSVDDVGPARGHLHMVPPGDFYFVEFENWPGVSARDTWKKLYRLRAGKMMLLKKFAFGSAGYGQLVVGRQGVLLIQHRIEKGVAIFSRKAFAFPSLKELKIKD